MSYNSQKLLLVLLQIMTCGPTVLYLNIIAQLPSQAQMDSNRIIGRKEYKGSNIAEKKTSWKLKVKKNNIGDIVRSKATEKLISVVCVPIKTGAKGFVGGA